MRSLVLSDLHLGARGDRAQLGDPAVRERLLAALPEVECLVLLGDVAEMREGPLRDALAAASRVLSDVVRALPSHAEVVLVPGNHDHFLLAGPLTRREFPAGDAPESDPAPPPLGLEAAIDWREGEPLAVLAGALGAGGATVRVAYPGVWLREDVYATHGHYLDCHTTVPILERLSAGVNGRLLRRPLGEMHGAEDYEAVMTPSFAWLHAVAQTRVGSVQAAAPGRSAQLWQSLGRGVRGGRGLRRRALFAGLDAGIAVLNRAGLGPLRGDLSAGELRRAGLRAMGDVVRTLGIDAPHVIFGHTHRAGPLPEDDRREWTAPGGARLINSGCWVYEAAFLGAWPRRSPYRAGFAVRVDGDAPPELVNLLD